MISSSKFWPRLFSLVVWGFAALSVLSFATRLHWTGELLSNFRVQFLIAAAVLWLIAVLGRQVIPAIVLLVCVGVHLAPVGPYLTFDSPDAIAGEGETAKNVRILTLNLDGDASNVVDVRRLLYAENPDIIVLTELHGPLHRSFIADLNVDWTYRLGPFFENPHEVLILSRIPYVHSIIDRSRISRNMVRVVRFCPEKDEANPDCFTLVAAHPIRTQATSPHQMWRDATLAVIARNAGAVTDGRVIVAGDMNTTPWSPAFRTLLTNGNLIDSGIGRGLTPTWLSSNPLFGLLIDHVLVGKCIDVRDQRLGVDVGSDHYPVIADFSVRPNCSAPGIPAT